MQEKKLYVSPSIEVIPLTEDIIITSGENDKTVDGDGSPLWGAMGGSI